MREGVGGQEDTVDSRKYCRCVVGESTSDTCGYKTLTHLLTLQSQTLTYCKCVCVYVRVCMCCL